MPPTAELPLDDDERLPAPSAPPVAATANRPLLELPLPETVSDVKRLTTKHTLYAYKRLKDDFKFKHWCVFIPHPLSEAADAEETEAQTSAFLLAQFKSIGDSLPNDVLLLNLVTKSGELNLAAGADIARVLGYEDHQRPILIFTPVPRLTIYKAYDSVELLALKAKAVDGVAVSLGGVSKSAIKDVVGFIPKVFAADTPQFDQLRQKVEKARRTTTRNRRVKTALKVGGPIVTVLGAIGKVVFGGS